MPMEPVQESAQVLLTALESTDFMLLRRVMRAGRSKGVACVRYDTEEQAAQAVATPGSHFCFEKADCQGC